MPSWSEFRELNSNYVKQLRLLSADVPEGSFPGIMNSDDFKLPTLLSFEVWVVNSILIALCSSVIVLFSIFGGKGLVIFSIAAAILVLSLWTLTSIALWHYSRGRVNMFVEAFLHTSLEQLRVVHDGLSEQVKALNKRTANYFLALPTEDAQELLALVSLQGALNEVIAKISVGIKDPTTLNLEESVAALNKKLRFVGTRLDGKEIELTLQLAPEFAARKLELLQNKLNELEMSRKAVSE